MGIEFPEGYDESSREHLWQTFFIICYNIPHDTPEIWVCVLNKLFTMGKFRVLINHDDKDMAKKVEKILMKAELCGQYITPSIIEWLSSWLDPSIHAEVMEQHEAFRLRADVTDITGVTNVTNVSNVTNVTDVTALLSTN